jgi:hypothetical protein
MLCDAGDVDRCVSGIETRKQQLNTDDAENTEIYVDIAMW